MKKLLALLLTFVFFANLPVLAFSWKKKKVDPLDLKEKTEYVNMDFWSQFNDEYLTYYICQAIKNNHDARRASFQVEEHRQNIKYSFGQELPSLSVGANYLGIHIPQLDDFKLQSNAFLMPFIASYEPDFLLKNRDKTKSITKEFEAVKFDEKAIYISLASDVGTAYINIIQYDKIINAQNEILKVKTEKLQRQMNKFNRGVIDSQKLNAAKKDVETAKTDLATFSKNREVILTQLAVLTGISPENTQSLKRSDFNSFDYKGEIPSSVISDVIFSRPDVQAAEKRLEEAKINIRIARKEFLPSFRITGLWAFNTLSPGTFFSWQSSVAAILAGATQDIFKGGMKIADLKRKKARYEQLFENYRQTDLNAVKEVNDALCIIKHDTNIDQNAINYLQLQAKDFANMQKKYSRGVISYIELLDEKERLLNIAQNQTQTKAARIVNYITLYKTVGGKL